MRPPICVICDADADPDDGALLSFRKDAHAVAWHQAATAEPGFVGHPPDVEWFCEAHADAASALTHLTLGEAVSHLRQAELSRSRC